MRVRMMAPKRSSVAGNTPPIKRSQTSVVAGSTPPSQQTEIYQLLHRAAADAGGMEDEAFVIAAQRRRNLLHGGRGDAAPRPADRGQAAAQPARACLGGIRPCLPHAD